MHQHPWLQKLKLSNGQELPHRIMPSPLEGVMSPVFCRTVNELDLLDYWITPFIRLTTAVPGVKTLKHKLRIFDPEHKQVIVQLLGDNPRLFVDTIKRLQELGIAGINLNFGCPSKQVLSSNGGGKLLQKPDLMLEIIDAILTACSDISLSVKLRTGFSSPREMENFLPKMAERKLDFIIVHSRTVKEMYDEISDGLLRISQAVQLCVPVSVIASGDVFSLSDTNNIFAASSCAGITVARGLLRDPFLIRRLLFELGNNNFNFKENGQSIFFAKMCEIARREPEYYKRSSFLEIAKFMWGEDSLKFTNIIRMDNNEILNFF